MTTKAEVFNLVCVVVCASVNIWLFIVADNTLRWTNLAFGIVCGGAAIIALPIYVNKRRARREKLE